MNNNPNSWSPDGTKIVFTSNRSGRDDRVLFVMNADGSGVRQLTRGAARYARWGTNGRVVTTVSGAWLSRQPPRA